VLSGSTAHGQVWEQMTSATAWSIAGRSNE
jgi:hypothetical protein